MQNFDVERDARLEGERTFVIGGETFTYKPAVAPEALVAWADMNADTPEADAIRIMDETVVAFLEAGQEEKWATVRNPALSNPLTANDILGVIKWLVEEQTSRPTMPSSASSPGSGNGGPGTSLTGELVSPAGVGSAA